VDKNTHRNGGCVFFPTFLLKYKFQKKGRGTGKKILAETPSSTPEAWNCLSFCLSTHHCGNGEFILWREASDLERLGHEDDQRHRDHAAERAHLRRALKRGVGEGDASDEERHGQAEGRRHPGHGQRARVHALGQRVAHRVTGHREGEDADGLADDERQHHTPRRRADRGEAHPGVGQSEEEQSEIHGQLEGVLEGVERVVVRLAVALLGEEALIVVHGRHERDHRHQRERRVQVRHVECCPTQETWNDNVWPETHHLLFP
jgi:hypothetical protein